MQLLQGETLRDRLTELAADHKTISVDHLLEIALQICNGLQAAHEKGIIHRDIKPANIFLTAAGQVKILDFGLAKLVQAPGFSRADADEKDAGFQPELKPVEKDAPDRRAEGRVLHPPSTPADATLTRFGVALGTTGYMSPEQVRGERLDARTDIFSFGLVLYEMATGQRTFTGETAAVVHEAILHIAPTPARIINPELPTRLETVISRALEKDRERRFQTAAELRAVLGRVAEAGKTAGAKHSRGPWRMLAAAACLTAAVALVAGGYWRSRYRPRLIAGDTVVVAEFQNNTSDPAFNGALKLALETELSQTPFLDVLGPDKVRSTLKLMNHPESEPLSPALAKQVCLHTNSAAVVLGSIADEGNNYRIGLNAVNCKTDSTLASAFANAKSRSVAVRIVGNLGAQFRAKLGEPRNSVQQFNRPLDEATSSSIEALQAFGQAEKARMESGSLAAVPFLKRATDLDSSFALAWTYLGIVYGNLDNDRLQSEYLSRAYQLRNRVSRRDEFAIEASYYSMVEGDVEKSIPIYKLWLQNYPRDRIALINLGNLDNLVGENSEAAGLFREAIRLNPNDINAYSELMLALMLMSRLDEAATTYDEAKLQRIEIANLTNRRFQIAFQQHDRARMQQASRSDVADPYSRMLWLAARARVEEYYGRFRNARELWAQAKDYPERHDLPWNSWPLSVQALSEATAGNSNLALPLARQALAESRSRKDRGRAALSLALAGDDDLAENEARALDREYPVDTILQNFWLPTTRAVVELHRNQPEAAIRELQRDSHYEQFGSMLPSYVRGEAYLKQRQPAQAVAEFKKVLEHPSWTNEWAFGAIAHLQLGRAQAMVGDKAAARKAYQDFFTLWKDADPDVPILKQAKAEYAKLQ